MSKKVHFMGIGGSGMSAAAMLAKAQGFEVDGCDLLVDTPYLAKLKKSKVKTHKGHSPKHLKDVDILCVTPSVYYQNKDHEEVAAGKKKQLMTWQEFMGIHLQKKKKVVCITGTHGKSTTTTLAGLLLEEAGKNPTVQVGATVIKWGANYRVGRSNYFLCEADEFYGNFLHYNPDTIVLNNIEFDHPDFFRDEEHVLKTFKQFVEKMTKHGRVGGKTLIFNQNSEGIKKLFQMLPKNTKDKISLVGYTLSPKPLIETKDSYKAKILSKDEVKTTFEVTNKHRKFVETFKLQVPGEYNVENALGVIALGISENISIKTIKESLFKFKGSGRRMELLGEKNGIKVYDDYAHHPTAVRATLSGLRQFYPNSRIICIIEPHMYSRTKKLLSNYRHAFKQADEAIIAPIYRSRDKKTFGVNSESIVKVAKHKDIKSFDSFKEIVLHIGKTAIKGNVIVVMGAGDSYKLARDILDSL